MVTMDIRDSPAGTLILLISKVNQSGSAGSSETAESPKESAVLPLLNTAKVTG
jgi:hypothetical protein